LSSPSFPPVTPLRPAWQIALLAGGMAALIALSGGWMMGYEEPAGFGWATYGLLGAVFAMGFSGCTWAAAQWMSPTGRASLCRPALGVLLAFGGLALGSTLDVFVPEAAAICMSIGSVFSIGTALVMLVVFPRTAPMMRQRVATAAGILSGFAGFLAIQLHCPINELWHMLFGHGLLPVVWGLIGYWAARLAFR